MALKRECFSDRDKEETEKKEAGKGECLKIWISFLRANKTRKFAMKK